MEDQWLNDPLRYDFEGEGTLVVGKADIAAVDNAEDVVVG